MKGICKFCGESADYKNVNHCKKCHSKYCKENYQAIKVRKEVWRIKRWQMLTQKPQKNSSN